jgi:penicillin-binding protein 2
VGCHPHDAPLNLPEAVQNSCNAYFCNVFRNIIENPLYESQAEAFSKWREYVTSFGFGQDLDTDLPYERSGIVPKTEYYDRYYGENRWKFITVISLAIGQGELGITPLQMGNMTAAVANRGYYMTPHTVKKIEGKQELPERFLQKNYAKIDTQLYEPIIEGMELAVNGGKGSTARIAALKDIVVCGKTGTAENPHGEDHSIFVAFAPKDDPEIAVAVYVENGGYGSTYAAPIASLMIEKYLIGEISWRRKWIEQRMLNAELEYE